MASVFRHAAAAAATRSAMSSSKKVLPKAASPSRGGAFASPFNPPCTDRCVRRSIVVSALGVAESMLPLHSAIASTRLRSSIAVDSCCWSWLSQGLNKRI